MVIKRVGPPERTSTLCSDHFPCLSVHIFFCCCPQYFLSLFIVDRIFNLHSTPSLSLFSTNFIEKPWNVRGMSILKRGCKLK